MPTLAPGDGMWKLQLASGGACSVLLLLLLLYDFVENVIRTVGLGVCIRDVYCLRTGASAEERGNPTRPTEDGGHTTAPAPTFSSGILACLRLVFDGFYYLNLDQDTSVNYYSSLAALNRSGRKYG